MSSVPSSSQPGPPHKDHDSIADHHLFFGPAGLRDGSCGNHSGHEVSVCLNDAYVVGHSPEVLTYDNGRISAELSGEQCRNRSFLNRDLNPTFKGTVFFTCDHNATGAGHLTLLSVAEDGCGYSMNWITSAACVDLAEVECQAKGQVSRSNRSGGPSGSARKPHDGESCSRRIHR